MDRRTWALRGARPAVAPWLAALWLCGGGCGAERPAAPPPPAALTTPALTAALDAFDLSAQGVVQGEAGVRFAGGLGRLQLDGQRLDAALTYGVHAGGFDLAGGYAWGPQRLLSLWIYCRDGQLSQVWWADTAGAPLRHLAASGSCAVRYLPTAQVAALPALKLPAPQATGGFAVHGPALRLAAPQADGTSGALLWAGQWLPAWVFATVDCQQCGPHPWHELHFLAYDRPGQRLLSAILYLDPRSPRQVRIGRAALLPDLTPLPIATLEAQWRVDP